MVICDKCKAGIRPDQRFNLILISGGDKEPDAQIGNIDLCNKHKDEFVSGLKDLIRKFKKEASASPSPEIKKDSPVSGEQIMQWLGAKE